MNKQLRYREELAELEDRVGITVGAPTIQKLDKEPIKEEPVGVKDPETYGVDEAGASGA